MQPNEQTLGDVAARDAWSDDSSSVILPNDQDTASDQAMPPDPDDSPAKPRRRRPGRFRRFILRPLFWGLALFAVLIFALQLFLNTRHARDWTRRLIAERLSLVLERQVEIADIAYELVPLSVEVWGFKIHGLEPEHSPFLEVPWATVAADLNQLQSGVIRLREIRAERPRMYLQHFLDGQHNLIRFPRRKTNKPRRFDFIIDRVEVDRGEFFLDQEAIQMSISADAVRARFEGSEHLNVAGQVVAQNVVIRLPNAEPHAVAVSLRGSVQRGRIEIEQGRVSAPHFSAVGHGACEWRREAPDDKKCLVLVKGTTDGEMLKELGYFEDLNGELEFDGSMAWRPSTFGWRSRVTGPHLVAWGRPLDDVTGTLAADRYGVRFFLERARYADGQLDGTIDYESRGDGRPIAVALNFANLDADTVLADQAIPAHGFASRLAGRVEYRFPIKTPQQGSGRGEVEVIPVNPTPDASLADPDATVDEPHAVVRLPLAGAFPLRIEDGVVRSEAVSLRSAKQSILASGWYDIDRERGRYEYEIASLDVTEVGDRLPILDPGETPSLWLPKTGEGTLAGTLYLEPGNVATDLRLELENVTTASLSASRLSGGLFVTPQQIETLHLELGDEHQALLIRGRIPFLDDDPRGMAMSFDAMAWPLDEIRPWVPFELPMNGPISGHLELFIDAQGNTGSLRASATPATVTLPASLSLPLEPSIAVDSLSTHLGWDHERLEVHSMELATESGTVLAHGILDWSDESYDFKLLGSPLELGLPPFSTYLPRTGLAGAARLTARLEGRFGEPHLALELEAAELRLGERSLGMAPSRFELDWNAGRLQASGQLLELITARGGGALDAQHADIVLGFEGLDLGGLAELALAAPPAELGGAFRGELRLRSTAPSAVATAAIDGAPSPSPEVELDLELRELQIEYRDRVLTNLEPITLRLEEDRALIDSLLLGEASSESEIFLRGTLGYEASSAIDLRLQASLSATWLQLLQPTLDLAGSFDLLGRIGGTLERPFFDGQGEVHQARVMMPSVFPHSLEDLRGVLLFYPRSMVIDHLTAKLAGGHLSAQGELQPGHGDEPSDYRLQLVGEDLRLRYPEGWSLEGDAELTLRSTPGGQLLSGRAELSRVQYFEDVPVGLAQVLQSFFERQRLEVHRSGDVLSNTDLNVVLVAPRALRVNNNLADLSGSVDLVLRGKLTQPVLYGEVDIDPQGLLVYSNNEYRIRRGRLLFANPYELAPEVDLVATTKVREVEITLALAGALDRIDARFSSEPPLPDLEVFRLLSTGGDINTDAQAVRRFRQLDDDQSTSAASFLYGQAASVIGERVNHLFGFDKFRIDPLTGSGDNLSTARLTVGKRLSKDLFVSYSLDPSSTEDQRLRIEWQVSDGLTLVLTQNGDDSYSADARWETSF